MKESGLIIQGTVSGFKHGKMVPDMKENGNQIKLTARESFIMWTEIFLKESGKKIKLMATVFIHM
jgi:hypothetical protein